MCHCSGYAVVCNGHSTFHKASFKNRHILLWTCISVTFASSSPTVVLFIVLHVVYLLCIYRIKSYRHFENKYVVFYNHTFQNKTLCSYILVILRSVYLFILLFSYIKIELHFLNAFKLVHDIYHLLL